MLPNQLLHRGQVDSVDHVRLNKQLCTGLPCIVIEIRVYTASVMKIVPSVYAFLSTLSINTGSWGTFFMKHTVSINSYFQISFIKRGGWIEGCEMLIVSPWWPSYCTAQCRGVL